MMSLLNLGCSGLVQESCNKKLQVGMNMWHAKSSKPNCAFHPVKSELQLFSPLAGGHSIRQTGCPYLKNKSQNETAKVMAAGAGGPYLPLDGDPDTDPFWLWLVKEILSDIKFALLFLWEQPGQLKYIEWPSFQNTLKTATLTLLLVMLLIIFLSSVDSALSYLLALTLRRNS